MLEEEVWLVTLSELRLPINKEIYVVQRKRYGSGFFDFLVVGLFIVVKGKNKKWGSWDYLVADGILIEGNEEEFIYINKGTKPRDLKNEMLQCKDALCIHIQNLQKKNCDDAGKLILSCTVKLELLTTLEY